MKARAIFIFLVLLSCELDTRYFVDYAGVNLLRDQGFEASVWSTRTFNGTDDPLMGFLPETSETGPNGETVYSLEILNLVPNGDYEDATFDYSTLYTLTNASGSASYQIFEESAPPNDFNGNPYRALDNRSLAIRTSPNAGDWLSMDLLGLASSALTDPLGNYVFHYDYRTYQSLVSQTFYLISGAYSSTQEWVFGWGEDADGLRTGVEEDDSNYDNRGAFPDPQYSFSKLDPVQIDNTTGTYELIWGLVPTSTNPETTKSKADQSTIIDNLRLIKTDEPLYLNLQLASIDATPLTLIPGIYEFEFYVKDYPGTGSNNHFTAEALTLQVTALTKFGNRTERLVFPRPDEGWSDWTPLSIRTQIDFVDTDPEDPTVTPVLSLDISPTNMLGDPQFRKPGILLLTAPTMEFFER